MSTHYPWGKILNKYSICSHGRIESFVPCGVQARILRQSLQNWLNDPLSLKVTNSWGLRVIHFYIFRPFSANRKGKNPPSQGPPLLFCVSFSAVCIPDAFSRFLFWFVQMNFISNTTSLPLLNPLLMDNPYFLVSQSALLKHLLLHCV